MKSLKKEKCTFLVSLFKLKEMSFMIKKHQDYLQQLTIKKTEYFFSRFFKVYTFPVNFDLTPNQIDERNSLLSVNS